MKKLNEKEQLQKQCSITPFQEKDRYCYIVESLPFYIAVFPEDGKLAYANSFFKSFFLPDSDTVVGKSFFDLFEDATAKEMKKCLKSVGLSSPVADFEMMLPEIHESVQWIHWSFQGIFDKTDVLTDFYVFGRDITQRKIAEKALEESEKSYRDIVDRSPDMIHSIDDAGKIVFVNQHECEVLGYTTEELIGRPLYDIYAPSERKAIEDGFKLLKSEGRFYVPSSRMLKKDGTEFEVEIDSVAVPDTEGHFARTRTIIRDLSFQKEAERAIARSEEKYKNVVNNANEIILIAQDDTIKFANPKITEVTGFSLDEFYSKPFGSFIHPDDRPMLISNYQKRMNGEKVKPVYTFRIITKDEETKWMEIRAVLIQWDGKPGVLSFLTDVTERESSDQELKKKIDQMEFMGRMNLKRHKKMLEMQKEIIRLKQRLGEEPPSLNELQEFTIL